MQTSLDLSARAGAVHRISGRRVVASVSGGKDSAAMSLYLTELGIEHDRVFMDTGWEAAVTYDYLRGPLTDKLGPITEIRGELDFVQLVEKKGLFPSRVMRFCTELLKVVPIQRFLALRMNARIDDKAPELLNAVGIRRAESRARSAMAEWEWSDGFDLEVWRPIVTWTADDVAAIHRRHGLEMNPLYALGASRVGCWPCIHARKAEIALVARVDPARIDLIRALEQRLNERGSARDADKGRTFMPRSMFSYHGIAPQLGCELHLAYGWRSFTEKPIETVNDATYAAACDPPIARVVVFPQALLDGYRADFFASLHIEHRGETLVTWMAIECDGHAWHERTPQQAAYDRARDRALLRGCVPTIRFTGSEINRDANQCAREALDVLRALAVREMNIITDHAYNIALKYTDEAFAEVRKEREATAAATEGR